MRVVFSVSLLIVMFVGHAIAVFGQALPPYISVEPSLRVGYLFGVHSFQDAFAPMDGQERYSIDLDFKMPVIMGIVDISPIYLASGRFSGTTSFGAPSRSLHKSAWDESPSAPEGQDLDARGGFWSWEALGLLHVWRGEGHRFSITAGYRQENWYYSGEKTTQGNSNAWSRDDLLTSGPLLGLETSLMYPGWTSRFEILLSHFMNKNIQSSFNQAGWISGHEGRAQNGALVEARLHGAANVTPRLLVGLYGRYTIAELSGTFSMKTSGNTTGSYDTHMGESFIILGSDVTILF